MLIIQIINLLVLHVYLIDDDHGGDDDCSER